MTQAIILFAHGARDPAWSAPFEAVATALRAQAPGVTVQLAYLEFMAPDLPGAGAALVAQGCDLVTVVPLFLGAGGHVRKDLPTLVEALRQRHPGTQWQLAPAIGEVASVTQAMADAAWMLANPRT